MEKNKSSSDSKFDILCPDQVKQEPLDLTPVSIQAPSVTRMTSGGHVMSLVTNSSRSGTTASQQQQKAVLLVPAVSSKTGQMQNVWVSSTSASSISRSAPAAKMSDLSVMRTTSVLTSAVLPAALKGNASANCVVSSASLRPSGGRLNRGSQAVAVGTNSLSAHVVPPLTIIDYNVAYALAFNSRTIQADGTVRSVKDFLCNFCQFKVNNAAEMEKHMSTHLFSCNYCSFRSTSRLETLTHKRDSHPAATDELAGYVDLDHPVHTVKVSKMSNPRLVMSSSGASSASSGMVTKQTGHASVNATTQPTASRINSVQPSIPSSSVIMRTTSGKPGDSYFAYRIVHDSDGKVQAYECDVCSFQSPQLTELFTHVSTHSLADLAKSSSVVSGNKDILWECFYCAYVASIQVSVVNHVVENHPGKPIQLKRKMLNSEKQPVDASLASPQGFKVPVLSSVKPSTPEMKSNGQAVEKSPSAQPDKTASESDKKKKDNESEPCIWGCYYCALQSQSRQEVISHLKKEHAKEKLVVTRRRITRVSQADANATKNKDQTAQKAAVGDVNESPTDTSSRELERDSTDATCRKKRLVEVEGTDVQIGDIDSTDANQGSSKSRRKQVAPRKVADDLMSGCDGIQNSVPMVTEDISAKSISAAALASRVVENVSKTCDNVKTAEGNGRKTGRSKYSDLIKKLQMADARNSGETFAESLLRYNNAGQSSFSSARAEKSKSGLLGVSNSGSSTPELLKNSVGKSTVPSAELLKSLSSKSPATGGTKAVSLLTGQMVTGYIKPPTRPVVGSELDMPVLEREGKQADKPKTGLKASTVMVTKIPGGTKRAERLKNFIYDKMAKCARCGVCGSTTSGESAIQQIREHVARHSNDCKWACRYCSFECNNRKRIIVHVSHRHSDKPLRVVRREICNKMSPSKTALGLSVSQLITQNGNSQKNRLLGPRLKREGKLAQLADFVWQCPFCSRRSFFLGTIRLHMKLAHPDIDIACKPQQWAVDHNTPVKPTMKSGVVSLVRIEDADHFQFMNDVLETNGSELIHELDVDDEATPVDTVGSAGEGNLLEFRCLQCHFRGCSPAVVKCHVLQLHPSEDVTILDMRSSRRINHEHLFMCKNVECQFMSSIQSEYDMHITKYSSHTSNNIIVVPDPDQEAKKPDKSQGTQEAKFKVHLVNRAQSAYSADYIRSLAGSSRRTLEGEIEYNDDGTIKGVDWADANVTVIQCQHCDFQSSDREAIKEHLSGSHPRLEPVAIDVSAAVAERHAWLFFCPLNCCEFVAGYCNVYKHHMDVEHPDSESGFGGRLRPNKRRTSNTGCAAGSGNGCSRRSSSSTRDTSYSAKSSTPNAKVSSERHSSRRAGMVGDLSRDGIGNESMESVSPSSSRNDSTLAAESTNLAPVTNTKTASKSTGDKGKFDFSQRYECVLCSQVVATLSEMKSHLLETHDSSVTHQCIDRRARQLRKRQRILFCPTSTCSYCCKFDDDLVNHIQHEHPSIVAVTIKDPFTGASSVRVISPNSRVYQCSHCTFFSTTRQIMQDHMVAEHPEDDGSEFAEIQTENGPLPAKVVLNASSDAVLSSDDNSISEQVQSQSTDAVA